MTKIFNAAGIEVSTVGIGTSSAGNSSFDISEIVEGGVTSAADADALQAYIENELINTKEHTNGQYQTGNYAPWWTSEKGNELDPFQCTWWVYGRATMYLEQKYGSGRYPTTRGNGGEYYDVNRQNGWFNYGNVPKQNSIISWSNGSYGHVAYVEGVKDGYIWISHAGNGEDWYGITKIPLNEIDGKYGKLNGYIYLDSPNSWSSS